MSANQIYLMVCVPVEGTIPEELRAAVMDGIKTAIHGAYDEGMLSEGVDNDSYGRMSYPTVSLMAYQTVTRYPDSHAPKDRQVKVIMEPGTDGFFSFTVMVNNDDWGTRPTRIPNGRAWEVVQQRAYHIQKEIESSTNKDTFETLERLKRNLLA